MVDCLKIYFKFIMKIIRMYFIFAKNLQRREYNFRLPQLKLQPQKWNNQSFKKLKIYYIFMAWY